MRDWGWALVYQHRWFFYRLFGRRRVVLGWVVGLSRRLPDPVFILFGQETLSGLSFPLLLDPSCSIGLHHV